MNNTFSIANRLTLGAGLWSAVLLIAAALIFTTQYREAVHRVDDDRFGAIVDSLAVYAEIDEDGGVFLSRPPGDPRFERAFSGYYWQVSKLNADDTEIVLRSGSLFDAELAISQQVLDEANKNRGLGIKQSLDGPLGEPLRSLTKAFQLPDQETVLIITAAADRRPGDQEISRFRIAVTGVLGMFGIGLLLGIFFQVQYGLRPLFKMEQEISDIRAGRQENIEKVYPKELAPLASELNTLLHHNKEIVARARTHVGNLAHALKTPISVIINESQSNDTDFSKLVHRQASSMARQVDHHLRRASAAARAHALGAVTSVEVSASDLCRTMKRLFRETNIKIHQTVEDGLMFRGEKQDLDELLGNLLENACKWANSEVVLTAWSTFENNLVITIEDDGVGLTPDQQKTVMKRGEKLDEAKPGSGLGLSIVSDLAHAYGGTFSLQTSKLGGLLARLELPAAAQNKSS